MKKSIFLFFAAILCAMSALAGPTFSGGWVYFHNKGGWNDSNKQLCIGKGTSGSSSYTSTYTMEALKNTQLWYDDLPTSGWGDATYMAVIGNSSSWGSGSWGTSNLKNATHRTKSASLGNWGFSKNHYQMLTPSNGNNDATLTLTWVGDDINAMNKTITVKAMVSTDDGATYSEATSPGTLEASSFEFTNYKTCTTTTSLSSGKITCGYTANTTLTAADADGYTFDGWYNASGTKQTADKTLSINPTADATYYAYYTRKALAEETHDVTISYVCGSTSIKENKTETGVGVSTPSEIIAPSIDGYKFDSWSFGTGVQSTDAETANPIDIKTKTSGIYTLTANYSELPKETVYFINTPKWTDVKVYAYNSENAGWPGLAATKETENVGEYEVYSYTAIQGKHANVIFNGSGGQTADLDWTADKYYIHNYNGNTGWYTKEEAEALLVVPVVEETIYFVNNKKWTKVQAYAWNNSANNVWPGVVLTATGEKVADYDVYSYTAPQGYVNVIFNNKTGETGVQSADFVWTNGKYYYMDADANYAGGTKEEVALLVAPDPLATEVYLAGDMTNKDNWDVNKKEFKKTTAEATTASVTVTLAAQTYKFKLVVGGAWKGNTGKMERGGESVHEGGWSFDKDGYDDNCQIVADIAGDYTFTWDLNTKKLTVTYPPLPKYTVTVTAENGSVTGVGEYEQGSEANLVATPNAGYAFQNWTKGGEVVSTEATYTFTVTANVELVANFVPEVTHEVTVSYLCGGNPIVGQTAQTLAVGVTTPSTVSAPAITNYKFDSWTLGTGVQSEDDTKNPIQITTLAEGEYSLVANYTKIELTYTVTVPEGTEKCYIAGEMNSWSFQEMTPTANANEFTITIDGATTAHKYKYTCGEGWAFVEKKEDGSELDADRTYNANDVVAKWAEPAKCYLMGIGGDWTTGIEMEEDGDQFKLLCQPIAEGEQFKFKYGDTWTTDVENYTENGVNWVESDPGSGQYNITLPAGNYDFYYKKNDNKVWIGVCTPATPTPDYTREGLTEGDLGTICLPSNVPAGKASGATFYTLAGKDANGRIAFDEVNGELAAGVSYLFQATATEIVCFYGTESVLTPDHTGAMKGTFVNMTLTELTDIYYFAKNALWSCVDLTELIVPANCAYVDMEKVEPITGAAPVGVRRITLGVNGAQVATGVDQVQGDEVPTKMIINGQLFILRGEKMYDAQGKLVK